MTNRPRMKRVTKHVWFVWVGESRSAMIEMKNDLSGLPAYMVILLASEERSGWVGFFNSLCQAAFEAAYSLGYRHPDLPAQAA
jgi:hypothetical protein